jgi:hypothetical protein
MVMDPVHSSVDHGQRQSTVDCGQGLGGGSPEDARNGAPVCGTSPRLRKKGGGMAVILTGCRRGRRRDGTGRASVGKKWQRRHSVWAVLGRGEKRRGEGRGAVESGDGPLYIGAEGEAAVGD